MRPLRTVQPLPRYVRRKWLKEQNWAYFFEPPTWARKDGCPVQAEALGRDYEGARDKAESILLPLFDSWRTGGLSDLVPPRAIPGTFDWLVKIFKEHRSWNEIDKATQRMYEQGLNLVADHVLKDGCRVGTKQLTSFTRGFVDALYAKLLVVEEVDEEGHTIRRERRRFANAAMTGCRRAWFIGIRAQEKIVPSINPFARMGLKTRAAGQAPHQTPTATWEERFRFATRPGSSDTLQLRLQRLPLGNGCNVKSICSAPSRSSTTGHRNGRIAFMSFTQRLAKRHGGLCLMCQAVRFFPN